MYSLGNIPSTRDHLSDIADFIELKCFTSVSNSCSLEEVRRIMSIESDEQHFEGINDDDDILFTRLGEVFAELKRRKDECASNYPFIVDDRLIELNRECPNTIINSYLYLLLATRANMRDDRLYGDHKDATLLFEKLSELVLKSYFGSKAKTFLFGTSSGANFREKVENLLRALKTNERYRQPIGSNGRQKDGKLDLVVWIPFSDERDSMFIGFVQCKTGTSWDDKLAELQPSVFLDCYTSYKPIHTPSRIFFIADSISIAQEKWEERARMAGILFDRRRIMEFLPFDKIPDGLTNDINEWNGFILRKYRN